MKQVRGWPLAEPEKRRKLQPAEESSSSSSPTPPTTIPAATTTTTTVPVPTRTGVKRAAEDPPDDTNYRDLPDDDDAAMDEFCVLERFEKERDRNPLLPEIVDEELEDDFLERIGFECAERQAVRQDLEKLGQNLNDVHVAEIFSPPRATAESHRFGLTPGLVFDIRTGWNLDDPKKLEQIWEYLRTERPTLTIGSSECDAINSLQSLNRDSPNFQRALEAGIRHMRTIVQIYRWQEAQGRWFLHENPFEDWSWSVKEGSRTRQQPWSVFSRHEPRFEMITYTMQKNRTRELYNGECRE